METRKKPTWSRLARIIAPYWKSSVKWQAFGLLGILLLLLLAVNGLNIVINVVAGHFMTALAKKDSPQFYHYLYIYASVFIVGTPIVVYYAFVRDRLALHWRNWLSRNLLDKYFDNRNYYRISQNALIDNPDERLAQDVDQFTQAALSLFLVVLSSIITLVSFIFILWSISTTLVGVVIAYAVIGSIITFLMGRRLVGLNFNQLRREADLRYGLIHVRNHAESIAFYRGEKQEKSQVLRRLSDVVLNFRMLIGWQRNLGMVTTGYDYLVVIIPSLIIAPLYFAGKIEFGTISQAGMAFSQVLAALSLIVVQFKAISVFAAQIDRLGSFMDALEEPVADGSSTIGTTEGERIALNDVTLMTPNGQRTLVRHLSVTAAQGEGLLIVGPSGSGKSSLLRCIAGLWNRGSGTISRPQLDEMMFLPQAPYMILGSLRAQLLYPHTEPGVITDARLQEVLALVNLENLVQRVGGFDVELQWSDVLSLGEQQRLAFARLLLRNPRYAIMDESTSALDIDNEERLYSMLASTHTTFISVGHRPSLNKYHRMVVAILADGNVEVRPVTAATGTNCSG